MQKGKLGIFLWVYPMLGLWSILVGNLTITALITGFAIAVEKNEWCTKQVLHVLIFQIYWSLIDAIMIPLTTIPFIGTVFSAIDFIIWLVLLILVIFLGMGKIGKGQDMGLPGKGFVEKAFGIVQQYANPQQHYQQYQQPNYQQQYQQQPQQPYQQPQQPYQQPQQPQQPYQNPSASNNQPDNK